ncbi:MAG: TraB/GumN family protein [Burkholderiaceae bacterium]
MTVQAVAPGPPIWRVSRGDHSLWILGTVSPLPKDTQWQPRDVEAVLAHADEVLMPSGAYVRLGFGSMFLAASLAPSARRMQYNPGRATLSQVLPPATHAQWLILKAKYIGKDDKTESLRPMFAADKLYSRAVVNRGMTMGTAWPAVAGMAKRHRIKVTDARLNLLPAIERKRSKPVSGKTPARCRGKWAASRERWTASNPTSHGCAPAPMPGRWATWSACALTSAPMSNQRAITWKKT